jgi:hypothetical protein
MGNTLMRLEDSFSSKWQLAVDVWYESKALVKLRGQYSLIPREAINEINCDFRTMFISLINPVLLMCFKYLFIVVFASNTHAASNIGR